MTIWCKTQRNGVEGQWRGDAGARLDPGVRAALESSFGVDLSGLRLHSGPRTDAFLRSRDLTAAAYGHRVFLPAGSGDAGGERWMGMLAHEVAHAVQQAQGDGPRGAAAEFGADAAAAAFLAGSPVPASALRLAGPGGRASADGANPDGRPRPAAVLAPPRAGHGTSVLAGFNSWEHVLLGDLTPGQMHAVTTSSGTYEHTLTQMTNMIGLWQNSAAVTPGQITAAMQGITVMTLPNGCVATYGEVCAVADYIANIDALDMPAGQMFPFLQQIRQETYNRLMTRLTGKPSNVSFLDALYPYVGPGDRLGLAKETRAIDQKTRALGVNHYNGLLARNACHFAPFAWCRWLSARTTALETAAQARVANEPLKTQLTDLARAQLGYADHFLQDSFAAGHLTNKTLVMQYFVEWAAGKWIIPVVDWESVRQVTFNRQPGLYGPGLYQDAKFDLTPNDPQTAEEQGSFEARMNATGLTGDDPKAYHQYLSFLSASTVQVSSNQVHDYFNVNGLTVSSLLGGQYLAYGDENLLRSPDQVAVMAPVLAGSKGAVDTVLGGGTPLGGVEVLQDRPIMVYGPDGNPRMLKDWNTGWLQQFAPGIFKETMNQLTDIVVGNMASSMGLVSTDQKGTLKQPPKLPLAAEAPVAGLPGPGLAEPWSTPLSTAGPVSVLWDGLQLFAAANGVVFQLDPSTGQILNYNLLLPSALPANEMRLASDGQVLYVGKSGFVFALVAADVSKQIAVSEMLATGEGAFVTDVLLTDDGALYASVLGYVYQLAPIALGQPSLAQLGYQSLYQLGTYDARLAASPTVLVAGINHKIVCLSRADISWVLDGYGTDFPSGTPDVEVCTVGDGVWAAVGGVAGPLTLAQSGAFSSYLEDGFDGDVRLGTDGLQVYVSGLGQVRAVSLSDTSSVWVTPLTMTGTVPSPSTAAPILADGANLFASANGYVFQLDPETGAILNQGQGPVGDAGTEIAMASDGVRLFCGATYGGGAFVTGLPIYPK